MRDEFKPPRDGGQYTTQSFESIILEKMKLSYQMAISEEKMSLVAKSLRVDGWWDQMRRRFMIQFKADVLARTKVREVVIEERPHYLSWKHQLIDSLPAGFRRRFLCYFWDIEDYKLGSVRTHTFTEKAGVVFPYADVPMPEELGAQVPYYMSYSESYDD